MIETILSNLPGYNCGACGYSSCNKFADAVANNKDVIGKCSVLNLPKFRSNKSVLSSYLNENKSCSREIFGVIDNYVADIVLDPLKGESSCREVLMPTSVVSLEVGENIEYRPLGCPIVHFATIIKIDGLLITVHIIGPCNAKLHPNNYKFIGCCMVMAFEGEYSGKHISVGETVRFLPKHCMMQKVHSGIIVSITDNKVLIEGIDLKVWQTPQLRD